ncbi:hypothetical protein SeLEV6574_g02600 [Synchytrium endobioticum]|uniref:DNL-type domain-containing protein n=1 Tax=Synchytrium endobioticum TaxID=286115 RepID=A0A507D7V2_9FUNG|nr:hypothetical protein SeLEV6574_g02600 [Synchytrium endobioticum]
MFAHIQSNNRDRAKYKLYFYLRLVIEIHDQVRHQVIPNAHQTGPTAWNSHNTIRSFVLSSTSLRQREDGNHSHHQHNSLPVNYRSDSSPPTSLPSPNSSGIPIGKIAGKLLFGYTCKICTTRQFRTMSKHAYEHGVVIVKCGGCSSLHLIADHLGWFDSTKKMGTIEDILKEQGREGDVMRLKVENIEEMEWLPDAIKEAEVGTHSTVNDSTDRARMTLHCSA